MYEFKKILGSGNFGDVLLYENKNDQKIAVKKFKGKVNPMDIA